MPRGASAEFKLSITKALADQLSDTLAPLQPAKLTVSALSHLQTRPGIYELFLNERRVYVGKASQSLPERLSQHSRKISGRSGINIEDMSFVAVYVDEDLDAAAPEKLLIKKYTAAEDVPWNTNGFGNKDPGRNRDKSMVKAGHFDALYPIDLDIAMRIQPGVVTLDKLLKEIKSCLPYTFRFPQKGMAQTYKAITATIEQNTMSVRDLMPMLVTRLPTQWQATALPGYVILYKESTDYESALMWWRIEKGDLITTTGPRHFAPGRLDSDEFAEEDFSD